MPRFNGTDLAHAWANRTHDDGRNAGDTFYFRGNTIFSYRDSFPIATMMPEKQVVLFTKQTYGNTTAKHKSYARMAISSFYTILDVDKVPHGYDLKSTLKSRKWQVAQLDSWVVDFNDFADSQRRARKNDYTNEMVKVIQQMKKFCEVFKIKPNKPHTAIMELDSETMLEEAKKQAEERYTKALAANKKKIAKWRKGDFIDTSVNGLTGKYTWLRVMDGFVRTSRGMKLPYEDCKKLWRIINICKTKEKSYRANGEFHKVGTWKIDSITTSGDVIAGCHIVQYSEALAIAKQENWI